MSHEGKQGGKRKAAPAFVLSKKEKKAKKEIATMVINDLKSSLGQKKAAKLSVKDDEDGEDEIYNLVRGNKSAMVIQRLDDEGEDYVPSRKVKWTKGVIMMISSDESDDGEYKPKRPPTSEGIKEKDPVVKKGDTSECSSPKSSKEKEEVLPLLNDDAFQSSSAERGDKLSSNAIQPRQFYTKKEKLKFFKEQQAKKYDSIKERTKDIEEQFDDLSTYLEKVEKKTPTPR
jgi:hypothetical protein